MPPADDDDQLSEDLAATSESLEADARRVVAIEEQKQDLERGDPRLVELSVAAEDLAVDIQRKSRIERELSVQAVDAADRGLEPN